MFVDKVKLKLEAGKGGNGIVAWRREKYVPKGGPSGGNGGRGGNVVIKTDVNELSLERFRNTRIAKAENGREGGPSRQQGRRGVDIILKVPCGTIVKDVNTEEIIYDLTEDKQEILVCKGGKGGRGNESFKTSTNQAPNYCTLGREGEFCEVEFELKLIADVGLVGFPNAGKSTLVSNLTHVRVKIAPYPFTTLRPNIGYIQFEDFNRVLIADIPGIIKDAHKNRGLGFEFLRHIERTKMLVYVIDVAGVDERDPYEDFVVLQEELRNYNPEMLERPFLVLLNKCDISGANEKIIEFRSQWNKNQDLLCEISALQGQGVQELRQKFYNELV